jgi:hypothetical protein
VRRVARNGSNCERSIGLQITVSVRMTAVMKGKRSVGGGGYLEKEVGRGKDEGFEWDDERIV